MFEFNGVGACNICDRNKEKSLIGRIVNTGSEVAVSALAPLLELWLITSTHFPVLRLCSCAENSADGGVPGAGCVGKGGVGGVTGGCGVVSQRLPIPSLSLSA